MTIRADGGPQTVKVPFRPLVAVGEGTIVQLDDEDGAAVYAEVLGAALERRRGQWGLYLRVQPVPTAYVLNGLGEYAVDVRPVEVVE